MKGLHVPSLSVADAPIVSSAGIVFFSGGTALNDTARVLSLSAPTTHIITTFDSGGSSAVLREHFAIPAVGDMRSRLLALADTSRQPVLFLQKLMQHRLPQEEEKLQEELIALQSGEHNLMRALALHCQETYSFAHESLDTFIKNAGNFEYKGASLGNLLLVMEYIRCGSLQASVDRMGQLLHTRGRVIPVSEGRAQLVVCLADGQEIVGQHKFTGKWEEDITSPIVDIWLEQESVKGRMTFGEAPHSGMKVCSAGRTHYGGQGDEGAESNPQLSPEASTIVDENTAREGGAGVESVGGVAHLRVGSATDLCTGNATSSCVANDTSPCANSLGSVSVSGAVGVTRADEPRGAGVGALPQTTVQGEGMESAGAGTVPQETPHAEGRGSAGTRAFALKTGKCEHDASTIYAEEQAISAIEEAKCLCYPIGSFFSSVAANILVGGIGQAIVKASCSKVFVPNPGVDPELFGLQLMGQIQFIAALIQRDAPHATVLDCIDTLLIDPRGEYVGGVAYARLEDLGMTVHKADLLDEKELAAGRFHIVGAKLAQELLAL